jgi:hypothetical protein
MTQSEESGYDIYRWMYPSDMNDKNKGEMMSQTIRVFYGKESGFVGRVRANFNWPPINATSVVHISAAEVTTWGSAQLLTDGNQTQNFLYHLGDADISVSNIAPHNGGVEFILHVNWHEPLNVAVTITVEDHGPNQFHKA